MSLPKNYRIIKYWDDVLGDYYYRLETIVDSDTLSVSIAQPSGNLEWARRQSKHYGIKITNEEKTE